MSLSDEQLLRLREQEFPVTKNYLCFNHAGVAPVCRRAADALSEFAQEAMRVGVANYADWMERQERARARMARFINAAPEEIAFIRNTSHGLSLVSTGLDWQAGDNVVTTDAEFPSNMYPWMLLREQGVELRTVSARTRPPTLEDFDKVVDERTRLLAISWIEFSTGCRFDLRALAELVHSKGGLLCADVIQGLGVHPLDVRECGIDFAAADGHKWLCSFEGTGIFYCRRDLLDRLKVRHVGWNSVASHMEFDRYDLSFPEHARRFEEGSLPLALILALDAAVGLFEEVGPAEVERRALAVTGEIREQARERGYRVLDQEGPGGPGPMAVVGGDFDPGQVHNRLAAEGVQLAARGGGLRFSPQFYNTAGEVGRLFELLDRAVGLSPA